MAVNQKKNVKNGFKIKLRKKQTFPFTKSPLKQQLDVSLDDLRTLIPIDPKWGIKKNSEGKNAYWFGYKGHLALGSKSQYILQSCFHLETLMMDKQQYHF